MIVVTCKGRLGHLKRTLPRMLVHDSVVVCTWDDHEAASWVRSLNHPYARAVELRGRQAFNKSVALNAACYEAIAGDMMMNAVDGRIYSLLVLDADTLIVDHDRFEEWYSGAIVSIANHFHVCLRPQEHKRSFDLTGVTLVSMDNFLLSGGYNESIMGWGIEDIWFRFCLALKLGLDWKNIPHTLFSPIEHSDSLRTMHYAEKDKERSNARNAKILLRSVRSWTGKQLRELDSKYRPLLSPIDK